MDKDKFWEYFDDESREYVSTIMEAESDFYEMSAVFVNRDLQNGGVALDIGNGGIINYDAERLERLDCADIYLNKKIEQAYRDVPNISFIKADITDMHGISDASYDFVIVQNVIHHLAEESLKKTGENGRKAIRECMRVLKSGGKLIICESTVYQWFEKLERIFYPVMMRACDVIHFDRVYQYSAKSLYNLLRKELHGRAKLVRREDIGTGKYTLFLGRKIPSGLLPISVTYYVVKKL